MNARRNAALAAATLAALSLAGCFGGSEAPDEFSEPLEVPELNEATEARIQELVQVVPSNYTFPGQRLLEPVVAWINGTVDSAANSAVESPQDDGGINLNPLILAEDVTSYLPPGQPAEIHIELYWYGNPGSSADLDIFVDVPGTRTHYDTSQDQNFNWNIPVKRMVVNTVGVEGYPARIGVQATNGAIAPGQQVPYYLEMRFDYAQEVLTPHHAWAFTVPEGAGGVVLSSNKVAGDEHIRAAFVIIDPQDNLVSYLEYDDIAIPTESVFVPVRQPGEYLFYAYRMTGGFLTLKADAPVPMRDVRTFPLVETSTSDFSSPLAPGIPEMNVGGVATPPSYTPAGGFTVEGAFPLRVEGWMSTDSTITGVAALRISGPKGGVVFDMVRAARADMGDTGSVGWTGDHGPFVTRDPSQLDKGDYAIEVVADGFTGEMGHTLLTYERLVPRAPPTPPAGGA